MVHEDVTSKEPECEPHEICEPFVATAGTVVDTQASCERDAAEGVQISVAESVNESSIAAAAEEPLPAATAGEPLPAAAAEGPLSAAAAEEPLPAAAAEETLPAATAEETLPAAAAEELSPAAATEDSSTAVVAEETLPRVAVVEDLCAEEQSHAALVAVTAPPREETSAGLPGVEELVVNKPGSYSIYRQALEQLNEQLAEVPILKSVADQVHAPPLAVAAAGCFSIAGFCLFGIGGQFISICLGVMLPAFESFKCIESFSNVADPSEVYAQAASVQFWLIYWVVVAAFASCEQLFYRVLTWIPFYHPTKMALLLWLYLPQTRGANHVYHWIVAPTLRKNRHQIDAALETGNQHFRSGISGAVTSIFVAGCDAGSGGVAQLSRTAAKTMPELSKRVAPLMRKLAGSSTPDLLQEACKKES